MNPIDPSHSEPKLSGQETGCRDLSHCEPARRDLSRREFVQTAAAAGASLVIPPLPGLAQDVPDRGGQSGGGRGDGKPAELAVAIIGVGSQGYGSLLNGCLKIEGIRFVAVCDIWPFYQRRAVNLLKKYGQTVNAYVDYREMLEKEPAIDAVLIATPDWMHAEQTIACLEAGKHVYCEKEMSNTLEQAREMVRAARRTGRLLQIGHQRRSNPRYWHAIKLIENDKVLGRITHCYGQWNRARLEEQGWPKGEELDEAVLKQYGYDTMERFRNWRWYRKFSGGAMADLGSHQVDVFNWVLKARPRALLAAGGLDYYKGREWYDNVMAIYEYATAAGPVRAFYQVLNTTSHGGFFETLMGDEGSLVISEDSRIGELFREAGARRREWEAESKTIEKNGREAIELKIGETLDPSGQPTPEGQRLLAESRKPVHQLHLENFFQSIREGTPLSCPAEVAYETCVTVLKANQAVEKGCRLEFEPDEFTV
jgi:predicted dehydrogenase